MSSSTSLGNTLSEQLQQQTDARTDALPATLPKTRVDTRAETKFPARLDLLTPWDLPKTLDISSEHLDIITRSLDKLESILLSDDAQAGDVAALLTELPATESVEQKLDDTGTPISRQQLAEYDRYFLIRHVHSDAPEFIILSGLIETCQVFLSLCNHDNEHDIEQATIQRNGFIEYIVMLRRMLDSEDQQ